MMQRAKTGKANMCMRNENTYQHVLSTIPVRYHLLLESKWPLRLKLVFFNIQVGPRFITLEARAIFHPHLTMTTYSKGLC